MDSVVITPKRLAKSYHFERLLGEGSQGKTWLARRLSTNQQVAIKELKFSKVNNIKSFELFEREIKVLKSLHIDGVPAYYGTILSDDSDDALYLIQEYIPWPSLQTLLETHGKFDEYTVLGIIEAVANILDRLETDYSPAIIHRDIKPSNIMCDLSSMRVALIDFGAVANPQKRNGGSTVAGTFGYMAPEQMMGDVAIQSDFYSLGATALHLLTGISPAMMPFDGFARKYDKIIAKYAKDVSKPVVNLISQLMAVQVEQRPKSAKEILYALEGIRTALSLDVVKEHESRLVRWFRYIKNRLVGKVMLTNGMVLCEFFKKDSTYLVYTFEVDHREWFGFERIDPDNENRKDVIRLNHYPYPVRVLYVVSDPTINCISGNVMLR